MSYTKTAVKKLLVEERKSMREKQKHSLFMRRTLSIYNAMKRRAADCKVPLAFGVEVLRLSVRESLESKNECTYCDGALTLKNFTIDHDTPIARGGGFEFANLRICCQSCNWQKGILTSGEFGSLLYVLGTRMTPEAAADVKRRLTIGGKWSWK